jgi:hypothetical protein
MSLATLPAGGVFPDLTEDLTFSSVGKFNGASGVAIAPRWAISARHVGGGPGSVLTLPGVGSFTASAVIQCPFADIELIRFDSTVLPVYTPLSFENVPKGGDPKIRGKVTIVGFGDRGTVRGNGTGYDFLAADGLRHRTVNMIEDTADIAFTDTQVPWRTYFTENDNPTTTFGFIPPYGSIPGEGGVATGDSGGGWFIFENKKWKLIAVTSARGRAEGVNSVWDYGGLSFATAVSMPSIRAWIEKTMALRGEFGTKERGQEP